MIHLAQFKRMPAKVLNFVQAISMALTSLFFFSPLLADSNGGTIWETGVTASSNFWTNLQNIYINGLFLPFLGLSLIGWAFFAKDEKMRGRFTTAIKIEVIVFVALQIPDIAIATFNQFAGWLNGNS